MHHHRSLLVEVVFQQQLHGHGAVLRVVGHHVGLVVLFLADHVVHPGRPLQRGNQDFATFQFHLAVALGNRRPSGLLCVGSLQQTSGSGGGWHCTAYWKYN